MSASAPSSGFKIDQRYKFAKLQVLIADSDPRSSHLVRQILEAFGIRRVALAYTGAEVLEALREQRIDIVITEWNLGDLQGLALVRSIRAARGKDKNLPHDMPIIMLSGYAGKQHVEAARDAGITEFVGKPFTAKTLSTRIIDVIDHPRVFVEAPGYKGPSRRRRKAPPEGIQDRRVAPEHGGSASALIMKPNYTLRNLLDGASAAQIITEELVQEAQEVVMKSESDFIKWATQDIEKLQMAFQKLCAQPNDMKARQDLLASAYAIKSQSGIFGYDLATVVSDLLVNYLAKHEQLTENSLLVVNKHIETMVVVFTQKVKEVDGQLGTALVGSLSKLVEKLG